MAPIKKGKKTMTDNHQPGDQSANQPSPATTSRRRLLFAGGAALAAGGAIGATATATAAGPSDRSEALTIECATLGPTIRALPMFLTHPVLELDEGDVAGSPFFARGLLYPQGTIKGDGFIPTDEDAIGHFMCRGHLLISPTWPAPHLMTHHEYYLGELSEFPLAADMLTSAGPEGHNEYPWTVVRAVTGGTGTHRGARGQVTQTQFATNTTVDEFGQTSPCFRFDFDIDLP
mgnify:CR=1 FL=1